MTNQISFRPATVEDAPFVALIMMEAVGEPVMEEGREVDDSIVSICRRDDTLYSYRNAVIAESGGERIGGLIAYDGNGYHETKLHTFSLIDHPLPFDPLAMDDETREGEYYLDSAAVLPEFRSKGYGRQIIEYGVECGRRRSLLPVLACSPSNAKAYALYKSLGFKENGHLFIFGEDYLRMTNSL